MTKDQSERKQFKSLIARLKARREALRGEKKSPAAHRVAFVVKRKAVKA